MTDITKIPTCELLQDKIDSLADMKICVLALGHGILEYSGGTVIRRLEGNRAIVAKINKELERREDSNED